MKNVFHLGDGFVSYKQKRKVTYRCIVFDGPNLAFWLDANFQRNRFTLMTSSEMKSVSINKKINLVKTCTKAVNDSFLQCFLLALKKRQSAFY